MIILNKIAAILTGVALSIGGLFVPHQNTAPQDVGAFYPSGGGTYRLKSAIGSTDTTIHLSSFKEPISNIPYTMSILNSAVGYGTIDPQTATKSEFISFTGITQNVDGSADLTGVTRGMGRSYPFTASSTFRQTHATQSIFILSDSPQLFNEYAIKRNDETITGSWTVPAPTAAGNPTPKSYVDALVNGGAVSYDKTSVAGTAGESFNSGAIVYFNKYTARWMKASALVASTSQGVILGIAQGAGSNGVSINGGVLLEGLDATQGSVLTPGQLIYLSDTAGATSTSVGTTNRQIGIVKSTTELYFDQNFGNPQYDLPNTFTATTTLKGNVISKAFGGDGSDGALSLTTGTTTMDLGGSNYVVKNYSSISISGTGALEFTNSNNAGSVVVFKSQGDCTIGGSGIFSTSTGAAPGLGVVSATGTPGSIGLTLPLGNPGGGQPGSCSTGQGCTNAGAAGTGGATTSPTVTATSSIIATKYLPIIIGAGGGGGGGGSNSNPGGNGGRGAGAFILQCGGTLNFTSNITMRGGAGTSGTTGTPNQYPGSGGGGGGGTVWLIYNILGTNTGTINVLGGAGGPTTAAASGTAGGGGGGGGSNTVGSAGTAGSTTGGAGGNGGTGIYGIFKNWEF